VAYPKILKGGGGGRQFMSPVLIYRKCAQRNIYAIYTEKRLFGKKWANRGREPPPPFDSASELTDVMQIVRNKPVYGAL